MKITREFHALLAAAVITLSLAAVAQAQTEEVLHSFTGTPDGQYSSGGLLRDSAGNLYGATSEGGNTGCGFAGCGTVFELSPQGGQWIETILYVFPGGGSGSQPEGSLIADADGNLYGVTDSSDPGPGLVYELVHNSDGSWTPSILWTFTGGTDGANPIAALVFDGAGNLYGTTQYGGDLSCGFNGCGVVFELSPSPGGVWNETVIHTFEGPDGEVPQSPLVFDAAGNIYGSTGEGGTAISGLCTIGCGVIFELTHTSGTWEQKVIHNFDFYNGGGPMGNLSLDSAGNLYGTASYGGNANAACDRGICGVVFELALNSSGVWRQIRQFNFDSTNGASPYAGVVLGSAGHIFGTTYAGGDLSCGSNGCGVAFGLTPTATSWTEEVLHVFGSGNDGVKPAGTVILDPKGNIYGTTVFGGISYGTVFEINP